jgi:hypothetical protein
VDVTDPRSVHKLVYFMRAEAETAPANCMRTLVDAGLAVYVDDEKRHRRILNAIVRAEVPLAYGVVKTGRTKIDDRHVFALPTGVVEADGRVWNKHRRLARKLSVWPRAARRQAGRMDIESGGPG